MTRYIQTNAYELALQHRGVQEVAGSGDNSLIRFWHSLCEGGEAADDVPWCSSFVNGISWLLKLPRSKSKAARSWLAVGAPVLPITNAEVGFDVVVLARGDGPQPGPEIIHAAGHVGFFGGWDGNRILLLGGNQGDRVSLASFPASRILGIRRLVFS